MARQPLWRNSLCADAFEEDGGEVALGEVGQDHDDGLAGEFIQLGQAHGDGGGGAARDADQQAFFLGQAAGEFHGFGGVHLLDAVHDGQIQRVGDESRADALDLVRARA